MYIIKPLQKKKAKSLGVTIKPSTKKNKKIDVFKKGQYITSIGDIRYKDYATYIKEKGIKYANKRRRLYNKRHYANYQIKNTPGYYAKKILW